MNGDSRGEHIGIVSNRNENEMPYLIHNFQSPGFVAEEDVMDRWKVTGHYRVKE